MIKLENQEIILTSNEPWGEVWYSKHNYAYELSKRNKVFFINPVSKWTLRGLFSSGISIHDISGSLSVVDYNNFLPVRGFLFFFLNEVVTAYRMKRALNFQKKAILWSFDPFRFCYPEKLGVSLAIFHCVDKYRFTHYGEKVIAKKANYIFCVSSQLIKNYSPYNRNVDEIPHGLSEDEFSVNEAKVKDIIGDLSEYGIYVGNIDDRLDYQQLYKTLQAFPDEKFVFVGNLNFNKSNDVARKIFYEREFDNLVYLGPRPFKQLKYFIYASKFCFAFKDPHYPGNNISSHKIFQYLALGKPVFSCVFTQYKNESHLLYMSDDTEAMIKILKNFLVNGENENLKNERISFVRSFTFENHLNKIEERINA